MNARAMRRYVDDLLRGRRPKAFHPDDFEAAQIRTAIDLQAARPDSDAPRREFLADLHRRLAAQMDDGAERPVPKVPRATVARSSSARRRPRRLPWRRCPSTVVDRWSGRRGNQSCAAAGARPRTTGPGRRVAASADVTEGGMRRFDVGSVIGFVRRVDGKPEAVSGVCTHQGCKLWFDAPDDRLRCPCHSTSFSSRRAGADPSTADRAEAVAQVDRARTGRRHRGFRHGAAEPAGLRPCNPSPYLLVTCIFRQRWRCTEYARGQHVGRRDCGVDDRRVLDARRRSRRRR